MLGLAHRMASRLAAAAVALALSGTPSSSSRRRTPRATAASARSGMATTTATARSATPRPPASGSRRPTTNRAGLPPGAGGQDQARRSQAGGAAPGRVDPLPDLHLRHLGREDSRPPPAADRFLAPPAWRPSALAVTADVAVVRALVASALRGQPETPPPRAA